MTIRDTRLQAAIVRDGRLLLVQCTMPGEPPFWVLPGGGREAGEGDTEAVAREVREELGVVVEVGAVLHDVPADPPDGMYTRWRTFACRLVEGEPAACGPDGGAELTAVHWLPLVNPDEWDAELRGDPFLYPQLERIRAALGFSSARAASSAPDGRAKPFRHIHSRIVDGQRHVWNVERLWELASELPVRKVAVADVPEVDRDCWFVDRPATIRAVARHCRRILAADLTLPIILDADGALMDGGHRVARALMEDVEFLPAVRFELTPPADLVE